MFLEQLSVPSSSGKTLQRKLRTVTHGSLFTFQSPLHRGRLFNARGRRRKSGVCPLSVPSSSGKTLQLHVHASNGTTYVYFQSPLHRGRLFNGIWTSAIRSTSLLSVPSSSGKTLQREDDNSGMWLMDRFQSPLHRGRLFNRLEEFHHRLRRLGFQSPLHRGRLFNEGMDFGASGLSPAFSPLFIGEDSSTISSSRIMAQKPRPFSPLFIGEDSSTCTSSWLRTHELDFQSPLHRGRLFNLASSDPCRLRYSFQSPLHRGRLFNAARQSRRAQASRSFSPLFIGEDSSTAFYSLPFQQLAGSILSDFSQRLYLQKNPAGLRKH